MRMHLALGVVVCVACLFALLLAEGGPPWPPF